MEIRLRTRKNITIIDLITSEIDYKNTSVLSDRIIALIKEDGVRKIALNLEEVSWLTSSGVAALINIRKVINSYDGDFCIYNINNQILDSTKVLMIDRILPVFNSEPEAIDYLVTSSWHKSKQIFDIKDVEDVKVISLKDKQLDLQNAGSLETKATELIEKENIGKIIINLADVKFITSSGIGSLLSIYNVATNNNAKLCLCCISSDIMEALSISMVDKILTIRDNESVALQYLARL